MQKIRVGNDILQFPDDMSDDEITSVIQKEYGTQQTREPIQQQSDTIPIEPFKEGEFDTPEAKRKRARQKIRQAERSFNRELDQLPIIGGFGRGVEQIGEGGIQLLARGVDALTGGFTDLSTNIDKKISNREREFIENTKNTPLSELSRFAGGFAGGGGGSGNAIRRIATGAGIGSATSPVIQEKGREGDQAEFAKEKAKQLVLGLATGGVLEGGSRLLSPQANKELIPLAKKAKEFGIDLRLDQIDPTRFKKTAQKISQNIPLSGVDAQEAMQRTQWNKAVAKTLGNSINDLTPESINKFIKSNSLKYDKALKQTKINIFQDDIYKLQEQINFIKDNVSPLQFNKINSKIQSVIQDFQTGLDGVDFKAVSATKINGLRRDLLEIASKSQGDSKYALSETADFIHDILNKSLPKNKQKLLQQANKEYRNFKTIEPLLEKSTDGEINPTMLLNRVGSSKYINASKSGIGKDDLVDLARIGKQFLPKAGGSDTFEKTATAGIAGASLFEPTVALGAGTTVLGNKGFQLINQSQNLVNRALNQKKLSLPDSAIQGATRAINQYLGRDTKTQEQSFDELYNQYKIDKQQKEQNNDVFNSMYEQYKKNKQSNSNNTQPRGIRNNNPLNIEYNESNNWQGQTGTDGRFAQFESPEYGLRAGYKLLDTYSKRGKNTIEKIFNSYAPNNENNTQEYIKFVSKKLGVSPKQKLEFNQKTSRELLKAIVQMENGKNPYTEKDFNRAFILYKKA